MNLRSSMVPVRFAVLLALVAACTTDHVPTPAPPPGPDAGVRETPDAGTEPVDAVDANTLENKLLFGYQGWFLCEGDGSPWGHWFHWQTLEGRPTIDLWPDVSGLPHEARCPTSYRLLDGRVAEVFTSFHPATALAHFRAMRAHGLDGVFLQRFTAISGDRDLAASLDAVEANVRAAAEETGRVFAIMYDISGDSDQDWAAHVRDDWKAHAEVAKSPRYLHHGGKPVVAVWGMGFSDRPGNPEEAENLVRWLKDPDGGNATVVLGVNWHWARNPDWWRAFFAADVLSPWTVGRFTDDAGADEYVNLMKTDKATLDRAGVAYMPVVWPGFSNFHLREGGAPLNEIPRRGGRFWWRQLVNARAAGATMVYGAMFDEVDEGTAMLPAAPDAASRPEGFLGLDADGETLPADYYLRLAGAGSEVVHGTRAPSAKRPEIGDLP